MSVSTSIEACLQDLTEASRTSLSLKSIASDLATRVMADVDDVDRGRTLFTASPTVCLLKPFVHCTSRLCMLFTF